MRPFTLALFVFAVADITALLLQIGCARPAPPTESFVLQNIDREPVIVDHVIDGDTLVVKDGDKKYRVRLSGIDAPETPAGRQAMSERCGKEATQLLSALVEPGMPVHLERTGKDHYGRVIAYVYVIGRSTWLNVNTSMVSTGFVRVNWTYRPRHSDELAAAAEDARARKVGLWGPESACETPTAK